MVALLMCAASARVPAFGSPMASPGMASAAGDDRDFPRQAYVTVVTTPAYVIGAETLAKCLRHTGTQRPLLALVGHLVSDKLALQLEDAGILVSRIPDVETPEIIPLVNRPHFNSTFNKIHIFGLHKDFDTLVYLDADVLVLKNLDDLFELDLSRGPPIAAAPEIMPPDRFNTGVMVAKPSEEVYQKLLLAAATTHTPEDFDLGLFNEVFSDWFEQSSAHRLPFYFNVLQTVANYYEPAWNMLREKMRVLHFAGDDSMKPWSFSGTLSPSLAAYLYLWQSIARADRDADMTDLFKVLNITDAAQINALFQNGA